MRSPEGERCHGVVKCQMETLKHEKKMVVVVVVVAVAVVVVVAVVVATRVFPTSSPLIHR